MTGLTEELQWRGRRVRWMRQGSGPPVVFCHGTPWSSWLWAPFAEALAAEFTTYLWDMPGYGASSKDPGHAVSVALATTLHRWLGDMPGSADSAERAARGPASDFGGAAETAAALLPAEQRPVIADDGPG